MENGLMIDALHRTLREWEGVRTFILTNGYRLGFPDSTSDFKVVHINTISNGHVGYLDYDDKQRKNQCDIST